MNIRLRNPFKLRSSERIDSDASFLRIYSPSVLESLMEKQDQEKLWDNLLLIRSSPGAGKSSLLRIFEPNTLVTLFNSKSAPHLKELRDYLKKLDVIDNEKIKLLGVCLHCTRNYEILEDLSVNDTQKKRLFFALLNARIVSSTLRGLLNLKQLNFPDDLEKIHIEYKNELNYFRNLSFPCSGKALFDWAEKIESKVYEALDSFLPIEQIQPEGHDELFAFNALTSTTISVNGKPCIEKILFMFDDTHKLSVKQRRFLMTYVMEQRSGVNIWISERLEALSNEDDLRSFFERDYNEINLEEIWQTKEGKFKTIVANIASRRASMSTEDVMGFEENLEEDINESLYESKYLNAYNNSLDRIKKVAEYSNKFLEWLDYLVKVDLPIAEKSWKARSSEIAVHRKVGEPQLTMDIPLSPQELLHVINASEIRNISEFFVSREQDVPYYFGFDRLVKLASSNIDQFLQISAELYEAMLSNKVSERSLILAASTQEKIIRKIIEQRYQELDRLVPNSESVKKFLQRFYEFAIKETTRPTFPYAPGITGFAIKEPVDRTLIKTEYWLDDEVFKPLAKVLSICVSFNLLEKRKISQGAKGSEPVTVFYLNRWLCMRFNLPLGYGGWRPIKSVDLIKWIK